MKQAKGQISRRGFGFQAAAGLLGAFGAVLANEQCNPSFVSNPTHKAIANRPLITEPGKIVRDFLTEDSEGLYAYYSYFGSLWVNEDKLKALEKLEETCQKERGNPEYRQRLHRLTALPSIGRIHMIPYLTADAERDAVADQVSTALKDALNPTSGKANREVIEIVFQTLAAVLTNVCAREQFYAGPELLGRAEYVCGLFLGGEETLHFAALAAWQFLLGYEDALSNVRTAVAVKERARVQLVKARILSRDTPKVWWFKEFTGIHHHWSQARHEPMPQFQTLFFRNVGNGEIGNKARDFVGLVRATMAGVFQGIASGERKTTGAFMTPQNADSSAKIVFGYLEKGMTSADQLRCVASLQNLVKLGAVDASIADEFGVQVVDAGKPPLNPAESLLIALGQLFELEPARVGQAALANRGKEPQSESEFYETQEEGARFTGKRLFPVDLDENRIKKKIQEFIANNRDELKKIYEGWKVAGAEFGQTRKYEAVQDLSEAVGPKQQVGRREYGKAESNQGMSDGRSPEPGTEGAQRGPASTVELNELRHPKRQMVLSSEQLDRNAEFRQLMEELGETNQTRLGKMLGCSQSHISGILVERVAASRRILADLKDLVSPPRPDLRISKCLAEEEDPQVKLVLSKIVQQLHSAKGPHRLRNAEKVLEYTQLISKG